MFELDVFSSIRKFYVFVFIRKLLRPNLIIYGRNLSLVSTFIMNDLYGKWSGKYFYTLHFTIVIDELNEHAFFVRLSDYLSVSSNRQTNQMK